MHYTKHALLTLVLSFCRVGSNVDITVQGHRSRAMLAAVVQHDLNTHAKTGLSNGHTAAGAGGEKTNSMS